MCGMMTAQDMDIFPDNRTQVSSLSYQDPVKHQDEPPTQASIRSAEDVEDDGGSGGGKLQGVDSAARQGDSKVPEFKVGPGAEAKDEKGGGEGGREGEGELPPPVGDVSADSKITSGNAGGRVGESNAASPERGADDVSGLVTSARQISDVSLERLDSAGGVGSTEAKLDVGNPKRNEGESRSRSDSGSGSSESGSYSSGSEYSGSEYSDSSSESGSYSSDSGSDEENGASKVLLSPIPEEEHKEHKATDAVSAKTRTPKSQHSQNYSRLPSHSSKGHTKEMKPFILPPTKKKSFFRRWFGGSKSTKQTNVSFPPYVLGADAAAKASGRTREQRLRMPKVCISCDII